MIEAVERFNILFLSCLRISQNTVKVWKLIQLYGSILFQKLSYHCRSRLIDRYTFTKHEIFLNPRPSLRRIWSLYTCCCRSFPAKQLRDTAAEVCLYTSRLVVALGHDCVWPRSPYRRMVWDSEPLLVEVVQVNEWKDVTIRHKVSHCEVALNPRCSEPDRHRLNDIKQLLLNPVFAWHASLLCRWFWWLK